MAQAQDSGNRTQQSTQQRANQPSGGQPSTQEAMTSPTRRSRALSSSLAGRPFLSSSPFGMARRVFDEMDRMMASMFPELDELVPETTAMSFNFVPRIDVTRRDDRIIVHAELPGISPDEIEVHASPEGLVIEGEHRHEAERTEGDVWQSERSYGRFYRMIPMPEGTDLDSAQARFENGVLEISLRAPEGLAGRRRIEIQPRSQQQGQGQRQDQNP
jgi:HSP20 family protein